MPAAAAMLFLSLLAGFSMCRVVPVVAGPIGSGGNNGSAVLWNPTEMPSGPIEDASCNLEELEQANDSQLYEILQEIKKTTFFRSFLVDLQYTCPLKSWRKKSDHHGTKEEEVEEDVFSCAGGGDEDEVDDNAPPLCEVQGGDPSPFSDLTNALHSLHESGFQSKAQQHTFAWTEMTDTVIREVKEPKVDAVISEDDLLPDSFWKDTCSSIGARDPAIINLSLNPERNTGYNGTHIWNAIYEENCGDTCLEERVLYKLMSALHTSTTLSIARHYYAPSRKKNRTSYEPNPAYFVEKFRDHPEYISNLHFGYAVLLRALRKATDFLYNVPIKTDNPADDERSLKLLRRLLDTSFISSCSPVFDAFDETAMFKGQEVELRSSFKGVFQNVSSILDCVQCQQCKLHGKLAMTGYGAALKVLFMDTVSLDDNEVVGLVNTLVKFSESLRHVRELSKLYLEQEISSSATLQAAPGSGDTAPTTTAAARKHTPSAPPSSMESYVDLAVGAVAALGRSKTISWENEQELIRLALAKDDTLLVLSAHYGSDLDKLFHLLSDNGLIKSLGPDAIVIGSGLAGLAATVNLLDRGGRVVLIEKEHLLGGNSNKASSGINACCFNYTADELSVFYNDTLKSAGASARPILIETLVNKSADAVNWLRDRVGVDLSLTAQLGGHSSKRTHRPSNGMAGAEIIYGLQKLVKSFAKSNPEQMTILLDSKVSQLLTEGDKVVGVEYTDKSGNLVKLFAPNVVLATGGFASDRSPGSYLDLHRPELINMATTAGPFSTGDGITLARSLGAGWTDMDKVQIHPTGWVDPSDPNATSKILAAELLRGVGGLVINQEGKRFCNELGTRAYVTDAMLRHDRSYAETGKWDAGSTVPIFSLVLSSAAAADAKKHVDLYTHKGLLTKVEGISKLAEWLRLSNKKTVVATMLSYQEAAKKAVDNFGKTEFRNLPAEDLSKETFYVGKITPVLHYCMGGITIDTNGSVVREDGRIIEGLHAAGEVSGGVHGENRLGGNSLLECTVYGTIVGKKLPVRGSSAIRSSAHVPAAEKSIAKKSNDRVVSMSELSEHNTEKDCWILINGKVYDLTEFAAEHPGGPDSILDLAGKDGTEAFAAVHNQAMLNEFDDEIIGIFKG